MLNKKQGFTLIEVMVVMAIIALLAILVIGAITLVRNGAEDTKHRNNAKNFEAALVRNYSIYKSYCDDDYNTPNPPCVRRSGGSSLTVVAANYDVQLDKTNCDLNGYRAVYNRLFINKAEARRASIPQSVNFGGATVTTLEPQKAVIKILGHDCNQGNPLETITIP